MKQVEVYKIAEQGSPHLCVDLDARVLGQGAVVVEGPELLQTIQAAPLVVLLTEGRAGERELARERHR